MCFGSNQNPHIYVWCRIEWARKKHNRLWIYFKCNKRAMREISVIIMIAHSTFCGPNPFDICFHLIPFRTAINHRPNTYSPLDTHHSKTGARCRSGKHGNPKNRLIWPKQIYAWSTSSPIPFHSKPIYTRIL